MMTPREFTEKAQVLHDEATATLEKMVKQQKADPAGGHHEERQRDTKGEHFTEQIKLMGDCLIENGFGQGIEVLFSTSDTDSLPTSQLPTAISESVLSVGGFDLRVYQLDDGSRIIDKDDIEKFFEAWAIGDANPTDEERLALAEFSTGEIEDGR